MRVAKSIIMFCTLISILGIPPSALAQSKRDLTSIHTRLAQEIRRELIMLSNYTVFDNLEFEIKGIDTVILSGQVTRPTLKSAAESVTRRLEGVSKVVNKIEVLPPSPNDDRIRLAVYRAVYSKPGLDRYSMRAVPPIHIIVSNGTVSLVGIVADQADKDLAGIAAKEVSGTFGVTNCLKIEKK